jgi:hypothetical protein
VASPADFRLAEIGRNPSRLVAGKVERNGSARVENGATLGMELVPAIGPAASSKRVSRGSRRSFAPRLPVVGFPFVLAAAAYWRYNLTASVSR